jgi:hypothetical protein
MHHLGNGPGNTPDDSPNGVQVQSCGNGRRNHGEEHSRHAGEDCSKQGEREDYSRAMNQLNLGGHILYRKLNTAAS